VSETDRERVARQFPTFDGPTIGICPAPGRPEAEDELYIVDFEQRMIRPLKKEDLQPLPVPAGQSLELRFVNVLEDLWKQVDVLDFLRTMQSVDQALKSTMLAVALDSPSGTREQFLSAAGYAYSNYIQEGAKGTVEMIVGALKLAFELADWSQFAQRLTVEAIIAALDPSEDVDFHALAKRAAIERPELVPVLASLAEVAKVFRFLRDNPEVALNLALEVMAEAQITLLELLRDAKIRDLLIRSALDHKLIGAIAGTIIGFVIWDIVIDELITLGLGKATRFVRHVVL
jgi:hypothetical protein